jgi:hypothetical protein
MSTLAATVHEARENESDAKSALDALVKAMEEVIAPQRAIYAKAKADREAAEDHLRLAARAAYDATGDRKAEPGAEVKLFDMPRYDDAEALEWAKGSGMCLTLDKKAFEKVAKATALPFVTIEQEPRVSLASDLSAVVGA